MSLESLARRAALLGFALGWPGHVLGRAALPQRLDELQWQEAMRARGIAVGAGGSLDRPFFVFFDPHCPYCARLWKMDLPADLGGSVSEFPAIWVPVAYLKPSSFSTAVAILRNGTADGLARCFEPNEARGALADPGEPLLSERLILERNLRIWRAISQASPLMVWRMRSARLPARWMGLPSPEQLERFLRDVDG